MIFAYKNRHKQSTKISENQNTKFKASIRKLSYAVRYEQMIASENETEYTEILCNNSKIKFGIFLSYRANYSAQK